MSAPSITDNTIFTHQHNIYTFITNIHTSTQHLHVYHRHTSHHTWTQTSHRRIIYRATTQPRSTTSQEGTQKAQRERKASDMISFHLRTIFCSAFSLSWFICRLTRPHYIPPSLADSGIFRAAYLTNLDSLACAAGYGMGFSCIERGMSGCDSWAIIFCIWRINGVYGRSWDDIPPSGCFGI